MNDLNYLIEHIKGQINRAHELIEVNIILNDYEKKILKDNWDYIRAELTNYITSSNFIMYSLEKDSKGKNTLNIRF